MRFAAIVLLSLAASAAALAPIPGAPNTMDRGFDMIAAAQNNSEGPALLPVFDFTYDDGNTWTDPSDPTLTWAVPDQLAVTNVDQSVQVVNDALCFTYEDWTTVVSKGFNVQAGVTVNVNGTQAFSANFKFNHESYNYQEHMKAKLTASGFSKKYWALYELESYPPFLMPLNSMFKEAINALPDKISTPADQNRYNQVIQYWGTHFIVRANFGGFVHLSTFVSDELIQSHSRSWVYNQFSMAFSFYLFNMAGGGYSNQSSIHMSSEFTAESKSFIEFRGGDLTLQSNTTINEWIKTIPQDSLYLNVTLSDLSILVQPVSPTKAALLQGVIKSYIKTGVLPATDGSITDYEAFYKQFDDVEVIEPPAHYFPQESVARGAGPTLVHTSQ